MMATLSIFLAVVLLGVVQSEPGLYDGPVGGRHEYGYGQRIAPHDHIQHDHGIPPHHIQHDHGIAPSHIQHDHGIAPQRHHIQNDHGIVLGEKEAVHGHAPDGLQYGHRHNDFRKPSPLNFGDNYEREELIRPNPLHHGGESGYHYPYESPVNDFYVGYGGGYYRKPHEIVGPTYDSSHGNIGALKPLSIYGRQYGNPPYGEGHRVLDKLVGKPLGHHYSKEHETLGPLHLNQVGLYGKEHAPLELGPLKHNGAIYGEGHGALDLVAGRPVEHFYGKPHNGGLYSKHAAPLYAEGYGKLNHAVYPEAHAPSVPHLDRPVELIFGKLHSDAHGPLVPHGGVAVEPFYGKPHNGELYSKHAAPLYVEGKHNHALYPEAHGPSVSHVHGGVAVEPLYGKNHGHIHPKHGAPLYGEVHGSLNHLAHGPGEGHLYGNSYAGKHVEAGYNPVFAPVVPAKVPLEPIRPLEVQAPVVGYGAPYPKKAVQTIIVEEKRVPSVNHLQHDLPNVGYGYGHPAAAAVGYPPYGGKQLLVPNHNHYPVEGVKLHGGSEISVTPSASYGYSYKLVPESLLGHGGGQPIQGPAGPGHYFDKVDIAVSKTALNTAHAIVNGAHPQPHHPY